MNRLLLVLVHFRVGLYPFQRGLGSSLGEVGQMARYFEKKRNRARPEARGGPPFNQSK